MSMPHGRSPSFNRSCRHADCLHLAVMQANGVDRILTFDNGFSAQPGCHPLAVTTRDVYLSAATTPT